MELKVARLLFMPYNPSTAFAAKTRVFRDAIFATPFMELAPHVHAEQNRLRAVAGPVVPGAARVGPGRLQPGSPDRAYHRVHHRPGIGACPPIRRPGLERHRDGPAS